MHYDDVARRLVGRPHKQHVKFRTRKHAFVLAPTSNPRALGMMPGAGASSEELAEVTGLNWGGSGVRALLNGQLGGQR